MFEHRTRTIPGHAETAGLQLLESCSFTWIFDGAAHRFRRVPRGAPGGLKVPAPWAEYHRLELDEARSCFTVELDRHGTRILRVSLHGDPCPHCQSARRPSRARDERHQA